MSKKDKSRIEEPLEAETVDETAESMVEETLPEEELEAVGEQLETQDLEELHKLLEEKDVESAKNLEGWQRSQAEFINYRKRMEREQSRMYEDAAARIIKRFLPLLDDLHRALQNKPENGDAAEWAAGIELVYRKMLTILEGEGVTVMDLEGAEFDPNYHEAISVTESPDHESGQIVEVIQQGYMIGERVLRAALVRVAS
jgi:molecular chaperone GrpE